MAGPSHDHHHHPSPPEALIRQAEEACRAQGVQFTPLRRRVFEELARSREPLGAYDLVERLGRERRIAPISVYRVLDVLIEAGLIHRIATRNTYLPCHHAHDPHGATVFLVCTSCGVVDEVCSPDLTRGLDGTAAAAGFRPGGRAVEVEGECASCRTAAPG
ncbi:Fur family transcriptional regulator [Enterovirga sp.]|jgi:Fur family zinc uptake transcriptional regulator|uniref:Fur family transcriptional regulator n=1 Tax=Enterovirga sp. TaxID=2026350 RepID=UPI00260B722E|nr:Fur family transcriptional regulator [Enterovirga sp.]MDB5592138.1 ferric uptake regulator, Fur family [Enterovirga sp.]